MREGASEADVEELLEEEASSGGRLCKFVSNLSSKHNAKYHEHTVKSCKPSSVDARRE